MGERRKCRGGRGIQKIKFFCNGRILSSIYVHAHAQKRKREKKWKDMVEMEGRRSEILSLPSIRARESEGEKESKE